MFRNDPLGERYANDPEFRAWVDRFREMFRKAEMTPADARTAVNYAAILEEMTSTRATYFYDPSTGALERR